MSTPEKENYKFGWFLGLLVSSISLVLFLPQFIDQSLSGEYYYKHKGSIGFYGTEAAVMQFSLLIILCLFFFLCIYKLRK